MVREVGAEWGHSEVLKGWRFYEGLERHHLLRNRPDTVSRHLLELSVHSLMLEVYVEACCCERRMYLSADLASSDLKMEPAGEKPSFSIFIIL